VLTAFIDRYLGDYLPRLSKGTTARVFVSTTEPQIEWNDLNNTFRNITKRYFVNCPGFGPHAMRHIVATALVKKHGSFTAAAKVLHDKEETVRKHYGFLIGDDGARWVEALWDDSHRKPPPKK
jgi:integrase